MTRALASGGVSKTVPLPTDVGVEQIEELFIAAWRLGVKLIAGLPRALKARAAAHRG